MTCGRTLANRSGREIEIPQKMFSLVKKRKEYLMLGQNPSIGAGRWPRICAQGH